MIYGFIAGVLVAVLVIVLRNIQKKQIIAEARQKQEDAVRKKTEIREWLITNITEDLASVGGSEWDESIQRMPEQYDRMERASFQSQEGKLSLLLYDKALGIAKIQGTEGDFYLVSGKRCSCMDYRERGLPCKHMYLLAMCHPEESITTDKGNEFEGLTFTLTGLKQKPVKEYIEKHGGQISNFYWRTTAALIHTDDRETKLISHAESLNVGVMTGDELMKLFVKQD